MGYAIERSKSFLGKDEAGTMAEIFAGRYAAT